MQLSPTSLGVYASYALLPRRLRVGTQLARRVSAQRREAHILLAGASIALLYSSRSYSSPVCAARSRRGLRDGKEKKREKSKSHLFSISTPSCAVLNIPRPLPDPIVRVSAIVDFATENSAKSRVIHSRRRTIYKSIADGLDLNHLQRVSLRLTYAPSSTTILPL